MILRRGTFKALGCENEIQIYLDSYLTASEVKAYFDLAVAECARIEEKYSRFKPTSIVSQINRSADSHGIEVDAETAALLNYAAAAYETSDGLFDITSGVLSRLWNFKEKKIPVESEIQKAKSLVGWKFVEWTAPIIKLSKLGMEIDFGGIGKEFAVDKVATLLLQSGIQSGLVNFGGDLRILGPHPDGKPWSIGIAHPRLPAGALTALAATSGAIATSGDYERFFEIDGKRYCHLINPKTGKPVEGVQAATVIGESCLIAGTAATVAMLYGPRKGVEYLGELGLPYIFVKDENSISFGGLNY